MRQTWVLDDLGRQSLSGLEWMLRSLVGLLVLVSDTYLAFGFCL
jgi:hypothetical protein